MKGGGSRTHNDQITAQIKAVRQRTREPRNPKLKALRSSLSAHRNNRTNPATESAAAQKIRGSTAIGPLDNVVRIAWTETECVSARWNA